MKPKNILVAICVAAALLPLTSCLGMADALIPDYGLGFDDLWYNGYGYGNNYYGGYYGPNYGYGPGLPPPPPPGNFYPQQPQRPSSPGASTPHRPAVPTTSNGSQRPGNNGLPSTGTPTVRPGNNGNGGNFGTGSFNPPRRETPASPSTTTTNRGRK